MTSTDPPTWPTCQHCHRQAAFNAAIGRHAPPWTCSHHQPDGTLTIIGHDPLAAAAYALIGNTGARSDIIAALRSSDGLSGHPMPHAAHTARRHATILDDPRCTPARIIAAAAGLLDRNGHTAQETAS